MWCNLIALFAVAREFVNPFDIHHTSHPSSPAGCEGRKSLLKRFSSPDFPSESRHATAPKRMTSKRVAAGHGWCEARGPATLRTFAQLKSTDLRGFMLP
jgi:hypothetical protein